MFEKTLVIYIYAETPLHPGSGTTIGGTVDLPIQRERHTEFPIIQGSSLKGVLRNGAETVGIKEDRDKIFGKQDRVGGISVTDARILAFPVRTLKGVFGWVTCPLVLDRYKRDLALAGVEIKWEIPKLKPSEDRKVVALSNSNLIVDGHIYIEDLQLEVEGADENLKTLICDALNGIPDLAEYKELRSKLQKDLIVVSDEVFRDLTLLTTEVATRIKIYEKGPKVGTVEEGPWSEEYLPSDTLLYSLILIPSRLEDLKPEDAKNELIKYDGKILQIGGDETIGKGFARLKVVSKEGS